MERVVSRLMCDDGGEISFLFGPWGAVDRVEAIRQIETGERSYSLQRPDGSQTPLYVVHAHTSARLSAGVDSADLFGVGGSVRIGV